MEKKMEKILYWIFAGVAVLGAAAYFSLKNIKIFSYLPCFFYRLTGFYCPGCGGTRAFWELCRGHLLKSAWYHPLVPCACILMGWYLISHTAEFLSKGRLKIGMRYRNGYLYGSVVLVLGNWILKNVLLHVWGISL